MPIEKPITTQPQTQIPISNQFQVLGNILKPSQTFVQVAQTSKMTSWNYIAKAHLMKICILKSHHFSKTGTIDLTKIFLKGKFFLQNDILKTRKLYEYILVDTDSVEIWYIQNKDSTKICYSKCKIFKIIYEIEWGQSLSTHKMFSQNFKSSSYDY